MKWDVSDAKLFGSKHSIFDLVVTQELVKTKKRAKNRFRVLINHLNDQHYLDTKYISTITLRKSG